MFFLCVIMYACVCERRRERESERSGNRRVFVFQVYLEARKEEQQRHQENLNMLSEEVSHIQEVRHCTGAADTPLFISLFLPAIICMPDICAVRVSLSFSLCVLLLEMMGQIFVYSRRSLPECKTQGKLI